MAIFKNILICISFILLSNNLCGQNTIRSFDIFTDTLLIINGKTIDKDRVLMKRMEFVDADTFRVNQKGMHIESFTLTAFALGNSFELNSDKPILIKTMKDEILNKQAKYKFVSLKNIILHTKDGRVVEPSTKTIKVIFEN